jgi:hypothetical protein
VNRHRRLRALLGLAVLITAVIAMHSMGIGHGAPAAGHAALPASGGHRVANFAGVGVDPHEGRSTIPVHASSGHAHPAPCAQDWTEQSGGVYCGAHLSPGSHLSAHAMAGMCLAVLSTLLLLMVARQLSRRVAGTFREAPCRRWLGPVPRDPPHMSTPSLSQLGVLRA